MLTLISWNTLADKYLLSGDHGNYHYVTADLLTHGARIPYAMEFITAWSRGGVGIVALQEVEPDLLAAIEDTGNWQVLKSVRQGKTVGQAMLVNPLLTVGGHYAWPDLSAHMVAVYGINYINAHLAWAPPETPDHPGVGQITRFLQLVGDGRAVIMTDSNDRPGGPVRAYLEKNGFANTDTSAPTAYVYPHAEAMDLIVTRDVPYQSFHTQCPPQEIPTRECPSDHVPVGMKVR